ncbi:hypothetical protein [Pseudoalteromonas piscicida]|uniref:Uncharacterized protein n=1 Tax=Pseudoalteromonas piscicida TaxID=43662 RepID=A0A2A5JUM0_PSEO7|nr:hypothetical protein [Pseudoalteromonas piscicida]PCK33047.1 hypothetical protein CEX98_03860 [Pseudoalteromonas piscicida]
MYINSRDSVNTSVYIPKEQTEQTHLQSQDTAKDLVGKTNLMYLLDESKITRVSNEQMTQLSQVLELSEVSSEAARQQYLRHGQEREALFGIVIDGKLMAYQNDKGHITARGGVESLLMQANGDINQLKALVQQQYPSLGKVEVYGDNNRPTNAEIFERFNGRPFKSFVNDEMKARQQASYQEQLARDEFLRSKLMFEQAPQVTVFKVQGEVIGSMDDNGFADIGSKLLQLAKQKGIDKEALKPFYTLDPGRTPEQFSDLLTQTFGDDVEVEQFTASNAPTRNQIRQLSN